MQEIVSSFFVIPSAVLPEFWQTAHRRNRISLLVICIMIFGMELFNMARVLFWSSSGLGTLNNRIYFGLYLSLFIAAALCIILSYTISRERLHFHLGVQYISVLFFLLWHVCMNAYDLIRNADAEIGIYYTAILGLSVFILMPAWLGFITHFSAYVLFMGLSGSILSSGDKINITCTAIVALAVSLTNSHHYATMIAQRQEINQMNLRLQDMAQRDALTGLLNRSAFQRCTESYLERAGATLLIVDLDNFKDVNDRYGHPCGDFVLKEVALCIQAAFPNATGLSRIGGDEFAVLTEAESESALSSAAKGLIRSVSQITWHGQDVGSGCSIGACRIRGGAVSYDQLYSEADRALYCAKGQGKSQFQLTHLP